ncbi:hypothetical protein [Dactylosporangium sp. CA-139066]|uniref:hypothetical protein n=1 Tax=Dactylosporangium sp. CA-139066 TaxID=3239930 RepID=UPI003D8F6E3F
MTSISGISGISSSYGIQMAGARTAHRPMDGQDPMTSVAKALSMSTDELKSRLRDGKSLTDVANAQGVSHDDLIAAIEAGKPGDAPAGKGPMGPPPGGGPGGSAALQDDAKRRQLGELLDSDTDDLSKLSPNELVQRLQTKGVDLGQLRSVLDSGDLLDVKA